MITIKPNDIKSKTNKISLKNNSSIVLGKIGDIEYEKQNVIKKYGLEIKNWLESRKCKRLWF